MIILRYLSREVFHTLLILMVVLLVIMVSNTFIRYLSQAAAGSINADAVINLISFTVPNFIMTLLPITLFLSIILAYGKLFADNELLVMFACGLTWKALLRATLMIAVVVAILVAILSLWLVPKMLSHRDLLKATAQSKNQITAIQTGRFMSFNGGKDVVYIGKANTDKLTMSSMFLYQAPTKSEPPKITLAPTGKQIYSKVADRPAVVLNKGEQYRFSPGQKSIQMLHFDEYTIPLNVNDIEEKNRRVTSMSLLDLIRDDTTSAWSELMWRFSQPISVFIVTVMGVALCRVPPRKGRFNKVIPAVLVFIIYFNLLAAARSWTSLGIVPIYLSVWWVHLLFLAIAMFALWRMNGNRWYRKEVTA